MTNLVPIDQAQRSALVAQRRAAGKSMNQNFADGIRDAFPVLSVKGKVFRARISGQETPFIDPQTRQPISYLDVILVNASRTLAKSYYKQGFTEGDMNPPDCWSLDSVRPDPSVANKVSPTCQNCPMNAFGSKITESGKQAKACQDARRVAVIMPHHLNEEQPMVLMLRVPQSSLKNLKAYSQLLERHQFEPGAAVTRIAFDYQEAYPKLLFNFVSPLSDVEFAKVIELADGPLVTGMLDAPDFENAQSTAPTQDQGTQHTGLGGMVRQEAPVLATGPVLAVNNPAPVQGQGVGQAPAVGPQVIPGLITLPDGQLFDPATGQYVKPEPKPTVQEVPAGVIELPDGKLFNPATGQYIERTQPAVQMAEPDPDTMTLPDGKFFNRRLNMFVSGPEKGAKGVELEQPAQRQRKPRKKANADPAPQQPDPAPQQQADAPATDDGDDDEQPELPMGQDNAAPQQDASANTPTVSAASMDLQSMLSKLVPPTKQ